MIKVSKLNQVQIIAFNLSSSCEAVDVSDEDHVFDASNLSAIMSSPTILFCTLEKIASSFFQQKMKWLHECPYDGLGCVYYLNEKGQQAKPKCVNLKVRWKAKVVRDSVVEGAPTALY